MYVRMCMYVVYAVIQFTHPPIYLPIYRGTVLEAKDYAVSGTGATYILGFMDLHYPSSSSGRELAAFPIYIYLPHLIYLRPIPYLGMKGIKRRRRKEEVGKVRGR